MKPRSIRRAFRSFPYRFGRMGVAAGVIAAASLVGMLTWYAASSQSGLAFTGPTQSAGTGGGTITTEGPNLSVGTSSSPGSSRLYIVASSTSASDRSIRIIQPDGTVVFIVQNDQKVSIATSTPSGSTSTLIVAGNALITGNLSAAAIYGPSNGSVAAPNVSFGQFAANTGGGNFSFPASLSISSTTAPSGGVLYVNGNAGVGTASPNLVGVTRALTISGGTSNGNTGGLEVQGGATGSDNNFANIELYNGSTRAVSIQGSRSGADNSAKLDFYTINGGALGSSKLTILPDGKVGIGGTPSKLLEALDTGTTDREGILTSREGHTTGFGIDRSGSLWGMGLYVDGAKKFLIDSNGGVGLGGYTGSNPPADGLIVSGNVGIGTSTPGFIFDVNGSASYAGRFNSSQDAQIQLRGTNSWAGVNFLDSANNDTIWYNGSNGTFTIGGGGADLSGKKLHVDGGMSIGANAESTSTPANGLFVQGNVDIGGGAGKLDVGTVDPVYTIGGVKYATYLPAMTGVKEETTGVWELTCGLPGQGKERICSKSVEFGREPKGSDLWLFAQTAGLSARFGDLAVLLSPAFEGQVWYNKDIRRQVLTVYARPAQNVERAEVSYRLTAPRFDASRWSNYAPESAGSGFILDE